MAHKLTTLGLTLAAVCAFGAPSVPTASAAELHSGMAVTPLTGSQIGTNQLDLQAGNVKCITLAPSASFPGTTASEVRATPKYSGCTAFGLAATVDTAGCTYLIAIEASTLQIDCPTTAGGITDEITITVLPGAMEVCRIDIPEQTIGLSFVNKTESVEDVEVSSASTSIHYRITNSTGKCGENGLHIDGRYTGSTTARAYQDLAHAEQVDLTVN